MKIAAESADLESASHPNVSLPALKKGRATCLAVYDHEEGYYGASFAKLLNKQ